MNDALLRMIENMSHGHLRNYIAPGVTSSLIGGPGHGKVRMFSADRQTNEFITPHSHRFSFTCLVLQGTVTNTVFKRSWDRSGDEFAEGTLKRGDDFGQYQFTPGDKAVTYVGESQEYGTGDVYSMTHKEVHSIRFSKGTRVLFFEGPEIVDHSIVLEPWSNGKRIPTFETRPWMFEKDEPNAEEALP